MASPAQILRSILIDLKLVLLPGGQVASGASQLPGDGTTYCYVGSVANDNDQCVLIKDTVGKPGGRTMDTGERHSFPGTKIIVRALDYPVGYALAQKIALALDKQILNIQTTVPDDDTTHYVQAVTREPNIIHLEEEIGNRRQLFVINARLSFTAREPVGYA